MLQDMIEFLVGLPRKQRSKGIGLQAMLEFLQIAFATSAEKLRHKVKTSYKVHITQEPKKQRDKNGQEKKLKIMNFWCFSAAFG